jgi:plasmid replication initiation protein
MSERTLDDMRRRASENAQRLRAALPAKEEAKLAPIKHRQEDFFLNQVFDAALKDDHASMEHPFFSLSKTPDLKIRHYEHNGNKVTVSPSATGIATIWDKDVLLFSVSRLIEAQNRGLEISRTIRLQARDLLVYCNRGTSGYEYEHLTKALERLAGTRIKTDIRTNGRRERQGFGLIESWKIVERTNSERMAALDITLSEWLYNAITASEVLTISRDYFRLRKGLERRLYELARKHCGLQSEFTISLETLLKKSGATCTLKEFRRQVREIAADDTLPEYTISLNDLGAQVTIVRRSTKGTDALINASNKPKTT